MYFLTAGVISWLISGRETYWPWWKCQRKVCFYSFPHWLICRPPPYFLVTTYCIISQIIFFHSLAPLKLGCIIKSNGTLWHWCCQHWIFYVFTSDSYLELLLIWDYFKLDSLPEVFASHWWCELRTLPMWVMPVDPNLREDFPLLSPPSVKVDKCKLSLEDPCSMPGCLIRFPIWAFFPW